MRRRFTLVTVIAALAALPLLSSPAKAITGGRLATQPYSHMAALYLDGDWICGASLVAPQKILTAAHCILDKNASKYEFVLGTNDLRAGGERIQATSVEVHPSYGSEGTHDVAILTLARASTHTPIRLADPATEKGTWAAGETARVIGFGGQAYPGLLADDRLREVDVPMVSDQDCDTAYGIGITGDFDATTMVCAGEETGVKDSCQGDSGGPLMVKDGTGAWIQVGVVSWGFGCGFPTQYGVYSRVGDQPLHDWIQARI